MVHQTSVLEPRRPSKHVYDLFVKWNAHTRNHVLVSKNLLSTSWRGQPCPWRHPKLSQSLVEVMVPWEVMPLGIWILVAPRSECIIRGACGVKSLSYLLWISAAKLWFNWEFSGYCPSSLSCNVFVNLTTTILVCYVLCVCSNLIKIIPKFTNHYTNLWETWTSKPCCQTLILNYQNPWLQVSNMNIINPISVGMT